MAFVIKDRVQQTGTAVGTSRFDLSGTPTGFQSFSIIGNSNTTYYSATDVAGNWEVGLGVYSSGNTSIQRSNILSSSSGGSAVTFSGTVTVFCTYPSSKAVYLDSSNSAVIGSTADIFSGYPKLTVTNGSTFFYAYSSTAASAQLYFFKSRSNTAYGTVLSTDTLGNIAFTGAMSNASGVFLEGAIIQGSMDGTPVFDDANGFISSFPAKISFYNRTGGYDTFQDVQLAESMRLSNNSVLSIGGYGFYLGSANIGASRASITADSNGDLILSADPNNLYSNSDVVTRIDNVERIRTDSSGYTQFTSNLVMPYQGNITSKSTTATLTGAELVTGLLNTTGSSYTVTLPTAANIESALTWAGNNACIDWFVINTASGTITIGANSNTFVGATTIATATSAQFRIRRTGSSAFTVYRLR